MFDSDSTKPPIDQISTFVIHATRTSDTQHEPKKKKKSRNSTTSGGKTGRTDGRLIDQVTEDDAAKVCNANEDRELHADHFPTFCDLCSPRDVFATCFPSCSTGTLPAKVKHHT